MSGGELKEESKRVPTFRNPGVWILEILGLERRE